MKKVLFIDRDGTLVLEPNDLQLDSFEKLEFYPLVFQSLMKIKSLGFELVMVTNQDGLGTSSFPEAKFWPVQNKIISLFGNEGIAFKDVFIDCSYPEDNSINRKPRTGMLTKYINNPLYNLKESYVIGDRMTDVKLAKNLGTKAIFINNKTNRGLDELEHNTQELRDYIDLETKNWEDIYNFLKKSNRQTTIKRSTKETDIKISLDLDGVGNVNINTGLGFFNHLLDQIGRHALIDLDIEVKGDLHVDEHHTIEDTALVLGEAVANALGNKIGIERYGFCLPMDDCLAQVALDFGGRSWLVWDANFEREKIGDVPTEMFYHFFKSFVDTAKANLNIKAEGINEHHKIESIFKAFSKALKMSIKRDYNNMVLPTTKGII